MSKLPKISSSVKTSNRSGEWDKSEVNTIISIYFTIKHRNDDYEKLIKTLRSNEVLQTRSWKTIEEKLRQISHALIKYDFEYLEYIKPSKKMNSFVETLILQYLTNDKRSERNARKAYIDPSIVTTIRRGEWDKSEVNSIISIYFEIKLSNAGYGKLKKSLNSTNVYRTRSWETIETKLKQISLALSRNDYKYLRYIKPSKRMDKLVESLVLKRLRKHLKKNRITNNDLIIQKDYRAETTDDIQNPELPAIENVTPILNSKATLLIAQPTIESAEISSSSRRTTNISKKIGDRGEEIVLKYLRSELNKDIKSTIRWVADEGEKPGWDIEYTDHDLIIAIEVKGTTGSFFNNIELTANEWDAAKQLKNRYRLCLVTNCLTKHPVIQVIKNPYSLFSEGKLRIKPLLWRIEHIDSPS
ncbi:MAG: DUF3883 domain-containing protein [Candidatus Electryonea clarkiae]|nr:DUF3883 domain-containing protein [Candidatus Electryonea clarkiae]MDP8287264.1 DUF3883 domain-containing protein [Candidatus Electryonea clarkiae]